jgi:hypothetical protein
MEIGARGSIASSFDGDDHKQRAARIARRPLLQPRRHADSVLQKAERMDRRSFEHMVKGDHDRCSGIFTRTPMKPGDR